MNQNHFNTTRYRSSITCKTILLKKINFHFTTLKLQRNTNRNSLCNRDKNSLYSSCDFTAGLSGACVKGGQDQAADAEINGVASLSVALSSNTAFSGRLAPSLVGTVLYTLNGLCTMASNLIVALF